MAAFGAIIIGFKRGFLQALFTTVGYIGGGVIGLALALHFVEGIKSTTTKFLIILIAILIGAEIFKALAGWLARFFRTRILWCPLRLIDSLFGVILELLRITVVSFLVLSVLLGSPWTPVRNAVAGSKIYKQMVKHEPKVIDQLRTEINKKLTIIPR